MGQTADQLRQEIDLKREDAASKIDEIESRVTDTAQMARDTVEQAKDTVTGTVEEVKGTVTETVEQVKSSIENVDFSKQIEQRPLAALGVAFAGGFLLGGVLGGDDDRQRGGGRSHYDYDSGGYQAGGSQQSRVSGTLRGAAQASGLDQTVSALGGTLMGMLSERVDGVVKQNFPELHDKMRQHSEQESTRPGQSRSDRLESPSVADRAKTSDRVSADRAEIGRDHVSSAASGSGIERSGSFAGDESSSVTRPRR